MSGPYFLGWDVGAWSCDKNKKSRDAIVILDAGQEIVGKRRGSLRTTILDESTVTARAWVDSLFEWCGHETGPPLNADIVIGIDAPLGFPTAFRSLLDGAPDPGLKEGFAWNTNPYLFRETERRLLPRFSPLSSVKDMIGSQASKAMHAVTKFFDKPASTGIWTDGSGVTAIETYPAICREEKCVSRITAGRLAKAHGDIRDAHVCAAVAWLFHGQRGLLKAPDAGVPTKEGWIWFPESGSSGG